MTKDQLINEAVEELLDADDDGSAEPEILRRRFRVAVESCWRDGASLSEIVAAAQLQLKLSDQ